MTNATLPLFGLRDPISSTTHFVAFLWAIYATLFLCKLCWGQRLKVAALACFGISMVVLYGASALYHALQLSPEDIRPYRLIDHSAIYILIAGSYTPPLLVLLRHRRRWWVLTGILWGLAIIGIACKWLLPTAPYWLCVSLYLVMGWVGLLPLADWVRTIGFRGLKGAFWGGMAYTAGCMADLFQWPTIVPGVFGPHEFFHVMDLVASACIFVFMVRVVVPFRARQLRIVEPTQPALTLDATGLNA